MRKLASVLFLLLAVTANLFAQVGPTSGGGGSVSSGSAVSGCTAYSLVYIDSGGNLACAQAAQNSNVSTAGNAITQINATISGSSATSNFFNVTGTFPSGSYTSGQLIAPILFNVAGGGGTAVSADTAAIRLKYDTGTPNITAGGYGNFGILSDATLRGNTGWGSTFTYTSSAVAGRATVTTGTEIVAGVWGTAAGSGNTRNFGVLGEGITGGALSIGVVGRGANSTNNIGGYFTLGSAVPTGTTVALVAENSSVAANIFEARDNGSAVFTIADGGTITATGAYNGNGGGIYSYNSGGFGFANNGGSSTTPLIRIETALTPDALTFDTDTTSASIHISERADIGFDFQNACTTGLGTAACTDPTLIVHSHNQDTGEFLSMAHDGKAGVIVGGNSTVLDGTIRLGGTVTLTESSATTVLTIPVAVSTGTGGEIMYTVEAKDATNTQVRRGSVRYAVANNSSGTETCGVYGVDNAATVNPAQTNDGSGAGAITSGTLTYAWTSDTTGTNQCVLKLNGVSSLTQTTFQIHYTVIQSGPGVSTGGD